MKRLVLIALALTIPIVGCGEDERIAELTEANSELRSQIQDLQQQVKGLKEPSRRLEFLASQMEGLKARLITNMGNIELSFLPEKAPIHCFNFITRAESGFYDGSKFHRVIPGFMIQGGDPNSKDNDPYNDGQGGPAIMIPHEFNDTSHQRGVLSMARVSDVRAGAGSQFFIMHAEASHLDNQYTAFGKVTSGMEVVDKIANVKTEENDPKLKGTAHPVNPPVIKEIEIYR